MDEAAVLETVSIRMGLLGYPDEAMEVQAALLESFHPEEVAVEAAWRPKWTASGPVVLIEPAEGEDIKDAANDLGDGGFESEEEELQTRATEVVRAETVAGTFVVSIVGRSRTRTLHRNAIGNPACTMPSMRPWEMNLPMPVHIPGHVRTASVRTLPWQGDLRKKRVPGK